MTVAPADSAIDQILAALDPEQRAAAMLGDGPAQIIAPAGSGKTTTLVARLGVLLSRGVEPDRICVVTFNRDAARELSLRIEARLGRVAADAARIEVRTLHGLARQVVIDARGPTDVIADRLPLLRAARRSVLAGRDAAAPDLPEIDELDAQLSAWKVEAREPSAAARAVGRLTSTISWRARRSSSNRTRICACGGHRDLCRTACSAYYRRNRDD